MPEIVEPAGQAQRIAKLKEMLLDRSMAQMAACLVGEYKVIAVIPCGPGGHFPRQLFTSLIPEYGGNTGRNRDKPIFAVLCGEKNIFVPIPELLKLPLNVDQTGVKVNIGPLQAQNLRLPQARKQVHKKQVPVALALTSLYEPAYIFIHERGKPGLLHLWQIRIVCRIALDQARNDSLLQTAVQDP